MKLELTHTRNSLPEKTRIEVAAFLQHCLSDTIDLMMQAKHAHWNVKGPDFIAQIEMFDKVFEDTKRHVDVFAERILRFEGTAFGIIRMAAKCTSMPEYPSDITRCSDVAMATHYPGPFHR